MTTVEIRRASPADVAALRALLADLEAREGHSPINGADLVAAADGQAAPTFALIARRAASDEAAACALVRRDPRGWEVDTAVAPDERGAAEQVLPPVLRAAVSGAAAHGAGRLRWWVSRPTPTHDRIADAAGLDTRRDLWQMRRPIPTGEPVEVITRPFEVGRDEQAWLDVNNRAFAWHPDQSNQSLADLRAQMAEDWFDPAGFLLHEREGRLAGFCWTKVHADEDPPLGEIYVIATDPDVHRRGLGRQLVLAGLDHLASAGLRIGMLYVDADNVPAVRLYDDLGFTVDHTNRAYGVETA